MTEVSSLLSADLDALTESLVALESSGASSKLLEILHSEGDISSYREQLLEEMRNLESGVISKYLGSAEEIVALYDEAEECDRLLASMQTELEGYLSGLRSVSQDIHHLQYKSHDISIHLKEKEVQQKQLAEFIDAIVISPDLIKGICEGQINELWVLLVNELSCKLFSVNRREDIENAAIQHILPELEKLKLKASQRIKDFFFAKFEELKIPKTNIQIIQRGLFVKLQGLLVFLDQHTEPIYDEVCAHYSQVMSKIYNSQFKSYLSGIVKDTSKSEILLCSPVSVKSNFSLAGRDSLIVSVNDPITISEDSVSWDQWFRSHQRLLVETTTCEFMFLADFFPRGHFDLFSQVFSKSLLFIQEEISRDVLNSFDILGLLVAIRLIEKSKLLMIDRSVPVLKNFHEKILCDFLWPRVKNLLDLNIQSLRKADVRSLQFIANNLEPHFVTRRYSELLAGIMSLMQPNWSDIGNLLKDLQSSFEGFLGSVAKRLGTQNESVFLINNWDFLATVFSEHGLSESEIYSKADSQIKSITFSLIENQLNLHFSSLILFVVDAENKLSKGDDPASIKEPQMSAIVQWFKTNWKTETDKLESFVKSNFSNLSTGQDIGKQMLTQLLLYYTRFQKIVNKKFAGKSLPVWTKDLVPSQDIMLEIKNLQQI